MAQYNSTTINSATPAVDLMTWLDTILTANSWTFVETWTSSTKTAKVYKSPSGSNSVASDFYLATYRASDTATSVVYLLFEDWDAVNKKARKYAPAAGTGITVNVADNTVTDATGVLLDSATLQRAVTSAVQLSVSTTYKADVTVNRLIVGSTTYTTARPAYIGVFDSLLPASMDPVPLCVWSFSGGSGNGASTSYGASTREPTAPASASGNFMVQTFHTDTGGRSYAFVSPGSPSAGGVAWPLTTSGDLYRGIESARICIFSGRMNQAAATSMRRGVCQSAVTSFSGGAIGDTLTVTMDDTSTRTYTLVQVAGAGLAHVFIRTS